MYQPYPGQTQLPEAQRPPAPAPDVITVDATKSAIEKRSPDLTAPCKANPA